MLPTLSTLGRLRTAFHRLRMACPDAWPIPGLRRATNGGARIGLAWARIHTDGLAVPDCQRPELRKAISASEELPSDRWRET
jgi:hypothetical protein